MANMVNMELVQQGFALFALFFTRQLAHFQYRPDVFFHSKLAEDGRLLSQIADAPARSHIHRHAGDILTI